MDPAPRRKAVPGCAWQSLLCLRPPRQKKTAAYCAHIRKLLRQPGSCGSSCPVATILPWLGSARLLGAVALEATRLSRCRRRSRLGHRELLLATKLVLLRELCQPPPGSAS